MRCAMAGCRCLTMRREIGLVCCRAHSHSTTQFKPTWKLALVGVHIRSTRYADWWVVESSGKAPAVQWSCSLRSAERTPLRTFKRLSPPQRHEGQNPSCSFPFIIAVDDVLCRLTERTLSAKLATFTSNSNHKPR